MRLNWSIGRPERKRINVGIAALALALTAPAAARDFGEHGGYLVVGMEASETEADKGGCVMQEEFAGPGDSRLTIMRYTAVPDIVLATVDNYNWSTKEDEKYETKFDFDTKYFEREAEGTKDGIYNGLTTAFPAQSFLDIFASSTRLHVYLKDELIDRLTLEGSAAARKAFDRCWAYALADERAKKRERDKWSDLPKDPFKK